LFSFHPPGEVEKLNYTETGIHPRLPRLRRMEGSNVPGFVVEGVTAGSGAGLGFEARDPSRHAVDQRATTSTGPHGSTAIARFPRLRPQAHRCAAHNPRSPRWGAGGGA